MKKNEYKCGNCGEINVSLDPETNLSPAQQRAMGR